MQAGYPGPDERSRSLPRTEWKPYVRASPVLGSRYCASTPFQLGGIVTDCPGSDGLITSLCILLDVKIKLYLVEHESAKNVEFQGT